jgi:hypothetical protein
LTALFEPARATSRASMEETPLSSANINAFVVAWYRALDAHAPFEEVYSMLATEGLLMRFPEAVVADRAAFSGWYQRVTHTFFDEEHHVHGVVRTDAAAAADAAELRVDLGWQASLWVAPEARSRRICMDTTQRWVVRRSARNGFRLEIQRYEVPLESLRYAPGFARL